MSHQGKLFPSYNGQRKSKGQATAMALVHEGDIISDYAKNDFSSFLFARCLIAPILPRAVAFLGAPLNDQGTIEKPLLVAMETIHFEGPTIVMETSQLLTKSLNDFQTSSNTWTHPTELSPKRPFHDAFQRGYTSVIIIAMPFRISIQKPIWPSSLGTQRTIKWKMVQQRVCQQVDTLLVWGIPFFWSDSIGGWSCVRTKC